MWYGMNSLPTLIEKGVQRGGKPRPLRAGMDNPFVVTFKYLFFQMFS